MNKREFYRFPWDGKNNKIQIRGPKGPKGQDGKNIKNINIGEDKIDHDYVYGMTGEVAVENEDGYVRSFRKLISDERYGIFRTSGNNVIYYPYNSYGAKSFVEFDTEIIPEKWKLLSLSNPIQNNNLNIFSNKKIEYEKEYLNVLVKNVLEEPYTAINNYRFRISATVTLDKIENIKYLMIGIVPYSETTKTIGISSCIKEFSSKEIQSFFLQSDKTGEITLTTEEYNISPESFGLGKNYTIAIFLEGKNISINSEKSYLSVNLCGYDPDIENHSL